MALLVTVLAGCALRAPGTAPVTDEAVRRERLLALDAWEARGRIAVKAGSGGGQGDIHWQQQGESARIRLAGPFGAGAYEIRWDPARLSITSRDGEFEQAWAGADAAERFIAGHLGWSFPAASVRYWVLGLADPGQESQLVLSGEGRPRVVTQAGWTVTFERFAERRGLALPVRLTALGPGARVRLVVDRWEF